LLPWRALGVSVGVPSPTEGVSSSSPYLSGDKICSDAMEAVASVEHDEQVLCRVTMRQKCHEDKDDEDEEDESGLACHTMFQKECSISFRPQSSQVGLCDCLFHLRLGYLWRFKRYGKRAAF
jgi:hypothetical protein